MTNPEHCYLFEGNINEEGISYYFVSSGERQLLKVVQYAYIGRRSERPAYNLGFGTVNAENGTLDDDDISANGDTYKVFNTFLNTIPDFFRCFPEAMVMVEGSDSIDGYPDLCRLTCYTQCIPPTCRNQHRRINLYKAFLNKHFNALSVGYLFYGGLKDANSQHTMEEYRLTDNYDSIFFIQK